MIERKFAAAAVQADASLGPREIRVVASTPTPDRAGDVMAPKGCDWEAYAKNPIVLADHDPTQPIGTAKLTVAEDRVEALITFAPAGVSAKADEYCGLAKAGVLNAVSVGFAPIERQPNKTGGATFTRWELMELSLVAVPCNPEALVVNRSAHAPAAKADSAWKCGASRNLPLGGEEAWDGPAAEASVFAHCKFDGDKPDTSFARKAFLAYDSAKPTEKGSYKEPFAKIVDGRLVAVPSGIRAAASRLPQADVPDEVKVKGRAVLDHYETKMKEAEGDKSAAPGAVKGFVVKTLWDVAYLAELLTRLGWAHQDALDEAIREGDDSKVPGMLGDALQQLAAAFVAMSREETEELLAGKDLELPPDDGDAIELAAAPRIKLWAALRAKAGAVLSAENREHRDAIAKCMKAAKACQAEISNAHVKAADLHDYLRERIEEMQGHIAEAAKHAKAMGAKKKPKPDDEASSSDDGAASYGDDESDDESDDAGDVELAGEVARRKRIAEALALSA